MKLHIDVVNQTLLQKTLPGSTPPRQGSKEYLWIEFAFSEDWRGLLKTVYFQAGEYSEPIILENDTVLVPSYFTQQAEFNVTLVGILGNLVIPTSTIKLTMQPSNTIWTAVPPDTDIPAYQQLVNLAQEAVKKAKAPYIGENGNWWEFKDSAYVDTGVSATGPKGDQGDKGVQGEKGDKGDTGAKGDTGDKGDQGYTPVKGVDYWTPTEAAEMDAAKTAAINAADNASVAEAAALNAASAADEAASSASISAQDADAAAGEARTKAAELQAKADAGDFDGADGYTPVRGVDYWTDADKAAINADIAAQVAGKVDKIDGKGLSTNDYTDADKKTVASSRNTSQHIETVTVTEEIRSIQRSGLNLKGLRVYGQNPDNPISVPYVRFNTANGSVDIWCSSYKYYICDVTCVNGLYYVELYTNSTAPTSTMKADKVLGYNAIKTIQTIGSAPITSITILGGGGKNLTVGMTFEIYGTEA